ncbi:glycosyltransferase family 39 protein [archaeon]|nr:glycosyltransferase family 39 protein [archaeon]MBL7057350.1 glycosyltransferase family 39 protein [Candidatus Woesearchaeota archaeon]
MDKKKIFGNINLSSLILMIVVSVVLFLSFYLMFQNVNMDETMLFSWAWIINYVNTTLFFTFLIVVCLTSYFISRINFKLSNKHFLITIFVAAFLLSSLTWNSPTPNPDVAEFYGVAKYVELNGVSGFLSDFGTPELNDYRFHSMPIVMGVLFQIFGESIIFIHIIMSILYAFIPILTFWLAKNLFNRKVAIISSLLIIAIPNMLAQSSMLLVDVPTVFFVLLSLLVFHYFMQKKHWWSYPLLIIVLFLTVTSKISAIIFLVLTMLVMFFIEKKKIDFEKKKTIIGLLISGVILFLVFLFLIIVKSNFFSKQSLMDLAQVNLISRPDHYVSPISFFFQLNPLIIIFFILFIILFFFKLRLTYLLLLVWVLFPFIFFHGTTLRYMMPAFPAIVFGAAIFIAKFRKPVLSFIVTAILLSSTIIFLMGYLPLLNNEFYDDNIRLAAAEVDVLNVDSVGVYLYYEYLFEKSSPKTEIYGYVFDYYSSSRVYYDYSQSMKDVYAYWDMYSLFDYYNNDSYLTPEYGALVIFSDIDDWQSIDYQDVQSVKETIEKDYFLYKSISVGKSGIEENKFVFIYLKN